MKDIQITLTKEELDEIAESTAKEMGIEMISPSKNGCYNCRWYEVVDGICYHPRHKNFEEFKGDFDICEKWEKQ